MKAKKTNFAGRKTRKFHRGGGKVRNASCQQSENELQQEPLMALGCSEKIKANGNTSNKIFG